MAITQEKREGEVANIIYKMGLIKPTFWDSCGDDSKS